MSIQYDGVEDFFKPENKDLIMNFCDKAMEKAKSINRKLELVSLYMIIVMLGYYSSQVAGLGNTNELIVLGPLSLSNVVVQVLTPVIFGFLMTQYSIYGVLGGDVGAFVKAASAYLYKIKTDKEETVGLKTNAWLRVITPISLWGEVNRAATAARGKSGFLFLPLLVIMVLPFLFQAWVCYRAFYAPGTLSIISPLIGLYFMAMALYFPISHPSIKMTINYIKTNRYE